MPGSYGSPLAFRASDSRNTPARRRRPSGARRASRWLWAGLALAGMFAVADFFAFDALPFMDLPAHAGLFALRHEMGFSVFEQKFYVLAPHVGSYFLFRLAGEILSHAFGPSIAIRLLAAGAVVALPLALVDARQRLYGETSAGFGFLGIVLGFGLMTLFGFASFLFGIALMIECTAIWLRLIGSTRVPGPLEWQRETALGAIVVLLFLTHGFAFVLFVAIVAITTLVAGHATQAYARLPALIPAGLLAAYAAWIERASSLPGGSVPVPQPRSGLLFQSALAKLSLLFAPTLMTRTGVDIVVCVVVWVIAVGGIVATMAWLRAQGATSLRTPERSPQDALRGLNTPMSARALLACCVAFGCAFVLLPHEIGWFGFVDGRLVTVVLILAGMCVPPPAIGWKLAFGYERVMPCAAFALVGLSLLMTHRFQDEARGYREVFARIPAFSRVLNIPVDPNSDAFTGHPFVHYDKLLLIDKPVLLSDVWLHQGSALYPRQANPILGLPLDYLSSDLRRIEWSRFILTDWDYVLLRTRPAAGTPTIPLALHLVSHVGGWWLYDTQGIEGRRTRP